MAQKERPFIVRALRDFKAERENELNLTKDDVIQVIDQIDDHWLYGYSNGIEGNFPVSHAIDLDIPLLNSFSDIFVVTQFYNGGGCFVLCPNDIIVELEKIDDSWGKGQLLTSNEQGLFPYSHVWKMKKSLLPKTNKSSENNLVAIVNNDLHAQLPGEISLKKGDHVIIYKSYDKMYYEGECNGQVGIFPKLFVTVTENTGSVSPTLSFISSSPVMSQVRSTSSKDISDQLNFDDTPPSYQEALNNSFAVESYARAIYDFNASHHDELSLKKGDIVKLIRYANKDWLEGSLNSKVGLFPKNYVEIIFDCLESQENDVFEYPPNTLALVLYDFEGEQEGDLPLVKDSIITLLKKLDDNWAEGQDEFGHIGVVPYVFLQILENNYDKACVSGSEITSHVSDKYSNHSDSYTETNEQLLPLSTNEGISVNNPMQFLSNSSRNVQNNDLELPSNSGTSIPEEVISINQVDENDFTNLTENNSKDETRKQKKLESRNCVITELLQSEKDYGNDLQVCQKVFLEDNKLKFRLEELNFNFSKIFANLSEVVQFNQDFLRSLEESSLCKKPEHQMIGKCFLQKYPEMKMIYLNYCYNHQEVPHIWKKYEENPEINSLLQKGLEKIKQETNCFDVPSLLIKPFQRLMKYPLLLSELEKTTEDDHCDKENIKQAIDQVTSIASCINELQRKKDIVSKYRNEDSSLHSKMSRLSLHSMKKKSSRLGCRITSKLGLIDTIEDKEFNHEMNKFKTLEKIIKLFLKYVENLIIAIQDYLSSSHKLADNISNFYAEKCHQSEVNNFRSSQFVIFDEIWTSFKKAIDSQVIEIIKRLLNKFNAPSKLIEKRKDKLLDLESANNRLKSNKDPLKNKVLDEERNLMNNNYQALNQQLLDDLPKFSSLGIEIFQECFKAFIRARRFFLYKVTKEMMNLLGDNRECSLTLHEIIETFRVQYDLVVSELLDTFSIIPKKIFENGGHRSSSFDRGTMKRGSQSTSVIQFLKSSSEHQSNNDKAQIYNTYTEIYRVTRNYSSLDNSEIAVFKDEIVGVIKEKDPSGNFNRWYVDKGSIKGFLPSNILELVNTSNSKKNVNILKPVPISYNNLSSNVNQAMLFPKGPAPPPPTPLRSTSLEVNENQRYDDVFDGNENDLLSNYNKTSGKESKYENIVEFDPLCDSLNVRHNYSNCDSILIGDSDDIEIERDEPPCNEIYVAAYPFISQGEHQLSLKVSTVVTVKYKCDDSGNDEWWLIEDDQGKKGYVPANYLKPQ